MNPMTNMKNVLKLSEQELHSGMKTSWHDQYKHSAWVFVGGLPYDLSEGDVICVFSQYGEVVNINLVRDKGTGKSRGFCFICYEDQRSTNLAVDNFNGIKLLNRTIRVDHCEGYKAPKDDKMDEETRELHREGCAPGSKFGNAPQLPSSSGSNGGLDRGLNLPPMESLLKIKTEKEDSPKRKKVKKEKKSKKVKVEIKKLFKKAKKEDSSSSSSTEDSSSESDDAKAKRRKEKKKRRKQEETESSSDESDSKIEKKVRDKKKPRKDSSSDESDSKVEKKVRDKKKPRKDSSSDESDSKVEKKVRDKKKPRKDSSSDSDSKFKEESGKFPSRKRADQHSKRGHNSSSGSEEEGAGIKSKDMESNKFREKDSSRFTERAKYDAKQDLRRGDRPSAYEKRNFNDGRNMSGRQEFSNSWTDREKKTYGDRVKHESSRYHSERPNRDEREKNTSGSRSREDDSSRYDSDKKYRDDRRDKGHFRRNDDRRHY